MTVEMILVGILMQKFNLRGDLEYYQNLSRVSLVKHAKRQKH